MKSAIIMTTTKQRYIRAEIIFFWIYHCWHTSKCCSRHCFLFSCRKRYVLVNRAISLRAADIFPTTVYLVNFIINSEPGHSKTITVVSNLGHKNFTSSQKQTWLCSNIVRVLSFITIFSLVSLVPTFDGKLLPLRINRLIVVSPWGLPIDRINAQNFFLMAPNYAKVGNKSLLSTVLLQSMTVFRPRKYFSIRVINGLWFSLNKLSLKLSCCF